MAVALTAVQGGGHVGTVALGWLSDRVSRKGVVQASLILSSVATLWLDYQGAFLPMLLVNLLLYGMVTRSRMTLTQAIRRRPPPCWTSHLPSPPTWACGP